MKAIAVATFSILSKAAARPFVELELDPHQLASRGLLTTRAITCTNSTVVAAATYTGSNTTSSDVRLRISNGGAGQSGLVGALARAYIDYALATNITDEPFAVDWITGDTTDSIKYITSGDADIAITYNAQAEYRALNLSSATRREYGFRDHFYLLGPANNTANLTSNDTVLDIFNKIVTTGDSGNGTRFLSRYDKSATNIKESLLFATIGQIPWALATSKWYHMYPQFPLQALRAASLLGEYTLSDRGTFLTLESQDSNLTDALVLYKRGEDTDPKDLLLNPASFLLGARVCDDNLPIVEGFMDWMMLANGGQAEVSKYVQPGSAEVLYTRAPNCTATPAACAGW